MIQIIKRLIIVIFAALFSCYSKAQKLYDVDFGMDSTINEARKLLAGSTNQVANPQKYFQIIQKYAETNNDVALYNLAECYWKGIGTEKDFKKAIVWFNRAGKQNNPIAYYRLGFIYKNGLVDGKPDYSTAFLNYSKSAALGYTDGKYAKAYMLYSGLGTKQDYSSAYSLFRESATEGNSNAMRFVGLCLRNGYGTQVNNDSAMYWLNLAYKNGNTLVINELNTKDPENADIAGTLVNKIKAAQSITKQTNPVNTYIKVSDKNFSNQIEGTYEGWLLKYDWSGQHVVKADKVTIKLHYERDSLKGTWVENDKISLPINAFLEKNSLVFSGMHYKKRDHYYQQRAELLKFDKAELQLTRDNDSIFLSGNLKLYSVNRREPAKPMFLALVQTEKIISSKYDNTVAILTNVNTYPNPFTDYLTLDFDVLKKSNIQIKIFDTNGIEVYKNSANELDRGSYTISIKPQVLSAGIYFLQLQSGKQSTSIKILKSN